MGICKIKNCGSSFRFYPSYQLCNKHYLRLSRHGEAEKESQRDQRIVSYKEDYALIPLGINADQGHALVDKGFSFLNKYKWSLDHGYARGKINGKLVYMHHAVIGKPAKGSIIDHMNRNRLDNRSKNLRETTQTQNLFNSSIRKDNKSGHRGVFWDKARGKWKAYIGKIMLGRFNSFDLALIARKNAEKGVILSV